MNTSNESKRKQELQTELLESMKASHRQLRKFLVIGIFLNALCVAAHLFIARMTVYHGFWVLWPMFMVCVNGGVTLMLARKWLKERSQYVTDVARARLSGF